MDQIKVVKKICARYHSILRKNNFFPDFNQEISFYDSVISSTQSQKFNESFILGVETSYFALDYNYRKILKYDFFYNNFSFWWEEFFNRRQYSKYKKAAIVGFIANLIKLRIIDDKGEIIE